MLSFGIRFGQGFDRLSVLKIMQSVPSEFDYDFLVIGSNPGGVACAREARLAGKKTAIIRWQRFTPVEEEGFTEDLEEMAQALEMSEENNGSSIHQITSSKSNDSNSVSSKNQVKSSPVKSATYTGKTGSFVKTRWPRQKNKDTSRKVRRSRLDLNNELFKRGQQCRKLMHNASKIGGMLADAKKCGWRVFATTPSLSVNWHKMTEDIMDFVMEENWKLMSKLSEESVEVIDGYAVFVNNHTVSVKFSDMTENEITADIICLAPSADYKFPDDVLGAESLGINCDDFYRMSEAPGKTLIVGSTPEAMECAGIMANFRFPVTVVSRSKILKGYDSEISEMIINDLKTEGVVFLEETTLKSVEIAKNEKQLLANLVPNAATAEGILGEFNGSIDEQFDTVLFAVGKEVSLEPLNIQNAGITCDPESQKILTDKLDTTSVPNIYAVGDVVAYRPEGFEISEMAGTLLGKRLFSEGSEIMDYSLTPTLILTPTEYAFVGLSEDAASYRLGVECIKVHYGSFKPLDFMIPPKNNQCFAKIIVFKPKDTVIGVHFYGPEAGEIIQGFAAALKAGLTMKQLQTLTGVPTTKVQEILKLKGLRVYQPREEEL